MSYIQDKLDEIERKMRNSNIVVIQDSQLMEDEFQGILKTIHKAFTNYHNHILEKIQTRQIKHIDSCFFMTGGMLKDCNCGAVGADNSVYNRALRDILSLLQDTNPKE